MARIVAFESQPLENGSWPRFALQLRAVQLLLAFGALLPAVYLLIQPPGLLRTAVADITFLLTSGGAAATCLYAWRRLGSRGGPWLWFGLGCAAWFAGQAVWTFYDLALGYPLPYPSLADVGYLGLFPCFFAGLTILIRRGMAQLPARELVLDSAIVIVVAGALLYMTLLQPLLKQSGLTGLGFAASFFWQVGAFGLIFLTTVALLWRVDLLGRGPLSTLLAGLLALTVGNVIYGRLALTGVYTVGHPVDLGWHEGFILIAIAGLIATRTPLATAAETDTHHLGRITAAHAALMMLSVLAVTGLAVIIAFQDDPRPEVGVAVGLSGLLLAARLGLAAIQSNRLDHRTRQRDRLAGVVAASTAIAGTLELSELLPRLASAAARSVGRNHASVYVFTEDLTGTEAVYYHGVTDAEREAFAHEVALPPGTVPVEGRMLALRRPVTQTADDPNLAPEFADLLREIDMLQTLVVPLLAHDQVLGSIFLGSPGDPRPFSRADIDAAATIGQQAGLAIYNARLLARSRRDAAEQAALLRVSQAAISNLDLRSVLSEIAQASIGIADAESCAIEIWHPETDDTVMAAQAYAAAWPGPMNVGVRYPLGYWESTRRALTTRQTLNLLANDPSLNEHEQCTFANAGTKAVLVVPLVLGDECLGIMTLFSRQPRLFSPDDTRVARELVAQVALAIDRARLHDALREQADTDGLTGVLNHRAILEQLDRELARSRRSGAPVAVLMIDLDGFKLVNDTHGHQVGDEVLRGTATLLRDTIRDIDHVGRYGGDEFMLVLPDVDQDAAHAVVRRLLDRAAVEPHQIGTLAIPATLSAGVAVYPWDGADRHALLSHADTRMYATKAGRR